jgi:hypothetical protein
MTPRYIILTGRLVRESGYPGNPVHLLKDIAQGAPKDLLDWCIDQAAALGLSPQDAFPSFKAWEAEDARLELREMVEPL